MAVENKEKSLWKRIRHLFVGQPRNLADQSLMHNISLIAFFAWVGLGADGLSSSCYGPPEAFINLHNYFYLGIFVALATAVTIFVISASYSQIIELFPLGGGGYIVASHLLSPRLGMISGCALLIDYVLTITVSIASGADAVFSMLPVSWQAYKLIFAFAIICLLILMNSRGVKESVVPLVPIFMAFVLSHIFAIFYALFHHLTVLPQVVTSTRMDIATASSELGVLGMIFLVLHAYSMGAGTFTGIEAVSNGLPILREPRVETGKKTMRYMSFSLSFMVLGLMISYLLYRIEPVAGKTINAILFENITSGWPAWGGWLFIFITLFSEGAILFVAAQAGFLDGPRVLANMASDNWAPKRFAILSDRFVAENGVLIMGISSLLMLMLSGGSVALLIVFYSINVFITFFLSQLGMVRHWWKERLNDRHWIKKISVNGIGLILTAFILISVSVIKFQEGGWITIAVTGSLVLLSSIVKQHYNEVDRNIEKLDCRVLQPEPPFPDYIPTLTENRSQQLDPQSQTAVFFVKNFNGVGVETISNVLHSFKGIFKNIIFVQFGLVSAGNLSHIAAVEKKTKQELDQYVALMKRYGYYSEGYNLLGIDTVDESTKVIPVIKEKFPNSVFFGGQVVFPRDSFLSRILHNYTLFSIQKRLYNQGIPFYIVPVQI